MTLQKCLLINNESNEKLTEVGFQLLTLVR